MQKTGLNLHSICHMKYLPITLCLVVFLSGCSFTENTKIAPPFKIELYETVDYKKNTVFDLRLHGGKPTIVNFWFPSCPPCVAETPDYELLHQKFKDDGLKVIGVELLGLDSVEDGQTFVERLNVKYMRGPDQTTDDSGQIVMAYKITGFPTTIFIDRDQNIARKWTGALNLEKLEELTLAIMN